MLSGYLTENETVWLKVNGMDLERACLKAMEKALKLVAYLDL